MIKSKKELKFFIEADKIMNGFDNVGGIGIINNLVFPNPICIYLKYMRKSSFYKHSPNKLNFIRYVYYYAKYKKIGRKLGFDIGCDVFDYGLVIPHYGSIVVNGDTIAGRYCVLHTSICIGGSDIRTGDGLYMSTGSMIFKKVQLGNNVTIAYNSVVSKDCPDNSFFAGTPAKLLREDYPAWYKRDGEIYEMRDAKVEQLQKK